MVSTGLLVSVLDRMAKAVHSTAANYYFNSERLKCKANAGNIVVGDQVMVKGQHIMPLTTMWDHHYTVTQVRGKVI